MLNEVAGKGANPATGVRNNKTARNDFMVVAIKNDPRKIPHCVGEVTPPLTSAVLPMFLVASLPKLPVDDRWSLRGDSFSSDGNYNAMMQRNCVFCSS